MRMREVAKGIPKALVPVRGEPFAFHQLRLLASQGVRDIVYVVGYESAHVEAAVGDGRAFGLAVSYVDEGEHLHGTGGALRFALDAGALPEEFAVVGVGRDARPATRPAPSTSRRRLCARSATASSAG